MLIFVGASASGKTELAYYLKKNYQYHKCITTTTRPMRHHETQDVDYHFVTEDHFQKLVSQGAFVETNQYHNYEYGLQIKDMKDNGLIILDPNGTNHITHRYPNDVFVCYVSSSKATRKSRMISRGDDIDIVMKRIEEDDDIFDPKKLHHIHYTLNNESKTFDVLAKEVHQAYQTWKREKQ